MALQQLENKMQANSLNDSSTKEAAQEGVGALLESLKGGDLSQITALFGGNTGANQSNNIVESIQDKLGVILQNKGMEASEAKNEASNTASDLINGLKEKFQSPAAEDKDFDLSNIAGLLGGDAGNILNIAKGLFGK